MANPAVADYLRSTPIVQWQQVKLHLTLDQVIAEARAKGLRLEHSEAINSTDYVVYSKEGVLLRRGHLGAIRFFIERR